MSVDFFDNEDETEETDETEMVEKNKETILKGQIVRSKSRPPEEKLKYENQELVDNIDKVTNEILKIRTSMRHRDHFFPELINRLNLKNGVEVGVDKAEFSLHLLNKSKIEKLYCVDTWQDNFGSNYREGYYDKNGTVRYDLAIKNMGEFYNSGRAVPMRMTSLEASKKFENGSLDFIYIDGDHSLEMLLDIYAWTTKLKVGGIQSGHDYKDDPKNSGIQDYWGKQLPYQIKTAVDYYVRRYGYKLNVIGGRTMSWFFVKNR